MQPADRVLFLSLRPAYADLILSGEKTVELRRHRPRTLPGTLILVYASSPARRVVGTCIIDHIGIDTPLEIWRLYGPSTGLDHERFADYFNGIEQGVAIRVKKPQRLAAPVSLEALRAQIPAFMPPQSFRYLSWLAAGQLLGERLEQSNAASAIEAHSMLRMPA